MQSNVRQLLEPSFPRVTARKDHPDIEILAGPLQEDISRLQSEPGKDIWLFGGGALFRSLCSARLVSTVEVSVIPILLGAGTPLPAVA
jgi:dihydrofolate reductase